MMYAVDCFTLENELASTEYFETCDAATSRAAELRAEGFRVEIVETSGESGDEGKVIG